AEDGIRDWSVTGVQTCALPICLADASAPLICSGYQQRISQSAKGNLMQIKGAEASAKRGAINDCSGSHSVIRQCPFNVRLVQKRSEERRVGKECRSRWSPCA